MKEDVFDGVDYQSRLHAIELLKHAIKFIENLDRETYDVYPCETNDGDAIKMIYIALGLKK